MSSDIITIAGAIITILGMAVTIWQAKKARDYSQSAKLARDSAHLSSVADRLKSAQDFIRDISPDKMKRGYKVEERIDSIRKEFDATLSSLPKGGSASGARELLGSAQAALNSYESSLTGTASATAWQKLQTEVQDTISELRTLALDGPDKR